MLNEADPSGEGEVCVGDCGNADIFALEWKPGYWDGCYHVLVRDWENKYYNVKEAQYRSDGQKLVIKTMTTEDALFNDPELPVLVIDDFVEKRMADMVAKWREDSKEIKEQSLESILMPFLMKLKKGHKILQDKKSAGHRIFSLHWDKIEWNKYGSPQKGLTQGECKIVFKSGLFSSVEDPDKIQWKLNI